VSEACDVLVIDDEKVVLDGIRRVLAADGLRVATAGDGGSALDLPAAAECRLVLCDLMLPDRSGVEVLRALRSARPGLPVIMMTGYAAAEARDDARRSGAAGFLAKPFDESELLAAVRGALAGAARARPGNEVEEGP
jgi:DNA-binding NtrC family response regulator